jgi:hypothetical protein
MKAMRAITPELDSPAALGPDADASPAMKRFEITLLIRHPDLDPDLVTSALGLQPHRSWKAGEPRVTPKGRPLPGSHTASCWNHVFRFTGKAGFSDEIGLILDRLMAHKSLLHKINRTGGKTELYVKLPGDQNLGDELSWKTLRRFSDLRVNLSLETFPEWR